MFCTDHILSLTRYKSSLFGHEATINHMLLCDDTQSNIKNVLGLSQNKEKEQTAKGKKKTKGK